MAKIYGFHSRFSKDRISSEVSRLKKDKKIIQMNVCGFLGTSAPMVFVKFEITDDVLEALDDKSCIGFNSNYDGPTDGEPDSFTHIHGVWKLIPVYQEKYIWVYDYDFPLKHIKKTGELIKLYKEDWEKFVDILHMKNVNYTWCAHRDWEKIRYSDSENYIPKKIINFNDPFGEEDWNDEGDKPRVSVFGDQDYIYVSVHKCIIPMKRASKRFNKYYVNFKDILDHKAEYIKIE